MIAPVTIAVAVMGFAGVVAVGFVLSDDTNAQGKAVRRLRAAGVISDGRARAAAAAANDPLARRKQITKALSEQDKEAKRSTVTMASRLKQAGIGLDVRIFWALSAVLGALAVGLVFALRLPPLFALAAGFGAGFAAPRGIVGFLAKRRTGKFILAFSGAIDVIVRGVHAGLPVQDCFKIIARESPDPVGPEFQRLVENLKLGMGIEQVLEKMCERMPVAELRYFAIVIGIQSKAGGNLGEALSNLAAVLRSRRLLREKIKAMSSEAVASTFIIGSLPPAVVLLITVTSPTYMGVMFTTDMGRMMLGIAAGMMVTGITIMRKMINFEF